MGEIFLFENPGEDDIPEPEVARICGAMLGDRTSVYRRSDGTRVVAAFTDEPDRTNPHGVKELILGQGASWHEAIARARAALRNGRAAHLDIRGDRPT